MASLLSEMPPEACSVESLSSEGPLLGKVKKQNKKSLLLTEVTLKSS